MRHTPNIQDSRNRLSGWDSPYRKPAFQKPMHRVYGPVVEEHNCVDCGWPFKSTSSVLFVEKTETGERRFRHALCPSLRERRILRAEALGVLNG